MSGTIKYNIDCLENGVWQQRKIGHHGLTHALLGRTQRRSTPHHGMRDFSAFPVKAVMHLNC